MDVAVVIPVCDDEQYLTAMIESLLANTAADAYSLFVYDRGASGHLPDLPAGTTIRRLPGERLASVLDAAAHEIGSGICIVVAPNSRFAPDWLDQMIAPLDGDAVQVSVPRNDALDLQAVALHTKTMGLADVIDPGASDDDVITRLLRNVERMGGTVVEQAPDSRHVAASPGPTESRQTIAAHLFGRDLGTALEEMIVAARNGAGVGELPLSATERIRERLALEEERQLLLRARNGRDVCWTDEGVAEPLVTIRIATYNRCEALMDLALPAALGQTYENIEVVVVGDHTDSATIEAMRKLNDPRVRFYDLPVPSIYPEDPRDRWRVSGTPPMNLGIEMAAGSWITTADDDDEMTLDHVEVLLDHARGNRFEFVWSKSIMETPDGWQTIGGEPLGPYGTTSGAVMWSSGLRFMRMSSTCWKIPEPHDHNFYKRMIQIGAHIGFVDRITYRYYPDAPVVATWQTVLLHTTAVVDRDAESVDRGAARRSGIDAVIDKNGRRGGGLEITNDVPADQFQQLVAQSVRNATLGVLRSGGQRLDVYAYEWNKWSREHVEAFSRGLIEGFSAAPAQPVPYAFAL